MGIRIRIQDPGLNKRMKFILEIVFFGLNDYRYIELTFGQILGFFYKDCMLTPGFGFRTQIRILETQ